MSLSRHGQAGLGALDFRASRAMATSDELGNYRIVHFATHGLLNSEHPEFGTCAVLVDEQGARRKDSSGFTKSTICGCRRNWWF